MEYNYTQYLGSIDKEFKDEVNAEIEMSIFDVDIELKNNGDGTYDVIVKSDFSDGLTFSAMFFQGYTSCLNRHMA